MLLENSTLAEVLVDPAQPFPGWESRRAGLLGSKGRNKFWVVSMVEFYPRSLTQPRMVMPGSPESQSQLKIRENTMVRNKVFARANGE